MTIPRVKAAGWAANETLTSAQETQLDINITHALDKTVAGDTLSGAISVAAGGSFDFQSTTFAQFESGSFITLKNGASIAIAAAATVNFTTGISAAHYVSAALIDWTYNGAVIIAGGASANALTMTGGANVALSSRSVTRVQNGNVRMLNWDYIGGITSWGPNATAQAAPGTYPLVFELKIPNGATLTSVTARLDGHASHAALPATMPILKVQTVDASGTVAVLGSTTDPSTPVAAYDVPHDVTVSGLSTVVDRTVKRYIASVLPEGGANAAVGAPYVYMVKATWTQTAYDED